MPRKKSASLKGNLLLQDRQHQALTLENVRLLQAIDQCGSITAAARQVGISYKTAWDRIDAMNNMSARALVVRSAGGAKGGGTQLTDWGKRVTEGFQALQDEHESFIEGLGTSLHSLDDVGSFIRSNRLLSSARNQYRGVITAIRSGAVNSEVDIALGEGIHLTAQITSDSRKRMRLKKKDAITALVKSSWVLVSTQQDLRTSARNHFTGPVIKLVKGAVNSEIIIDIGAEKSVCAIISNTSVKELGLRKGVTTSAFFKASSVILMRD